MPGRRYKISVRLGRHVRKARACYLEWQNRHLPQSIVLIIIATLIGIFSGVAAAALKSLIRLLSGVALHGMKADTPDIRLLIWPLAGVLLTGIFQKYVVRGNVARGTRIIRRDLDAGHYRLGPFMIFNPLIGCSMTIGMGASGGSEGPTALGCAAIGSTVGRWFGLSDAWLRLLVGIGGGAGIAAIFKSPMGGVLFTLEVLQMEMTTLPVLALIIACLLASSTAYFFSDFTFDILFDRYLPMDPHLIGWVIPLGVFCGLYSIYYNFTKSHATRLFTRIGNPWIAMLATGAVLSVGAYMFPTLFGEGFGTITGLVNGTDVSFTASGILSSHSGTKWMLLAVGVILLIKSVLVAAAYSGGGVAGDFVPTFFAGALAGYLFGTLCNLYLGTSLPVWFFALTGMGAVMAGTIHAPLMALFILCETTNTYAYLLPYLIAIVVSYGVVKLVTPRSWYGETGHDDLMALLAKRQTPSLIGRVGSEDDRERVRSADSKK